MVEWDRKKVAELLHLAAAKRRGHADHFDWPEKATKEWGIATEFASNLLKLEGIRIIGGEQHDVGQDPPDCVFVTDDGRRLGVEITELVDQRAIEYQKATGAECIVPWPPEKIVASVQELLARKDRPESVKGGPYDSYFLLIHTDEPMLGYTGTQVAFAGLELETRFVDRVYVLFSYEPARNEYPLLALSLRKTLLA